MVTQVTYWNIGILYEYIYTYAVFTVHPVGIPDTPLGNDVIDVAFVNVPVAATPLTHSSKQSHAEISVASIVMLLSEVQPLNIP